jgi:D-glycero-alpha-D-manno-heptose 1-phosphate guanylyltransferase
MNPIPLLVLAGGFGTRLRSAVSDVPKPLAPVGDRPYLAYLLDSWYNQGVRSFIFLLHHQAELISAFLAASQSAGQWPDCEICVLVEPQPMETGGAIAYAVRELKLDGDFLVANADTWLGGGIEQISAELAPVIAVVGVPNSGRYGQVRVESNKITAFEEKQSSSGPALINAGLYHLSAAMFQDWDGQPFSLERGLFPKWVSFNRLTAVELDTDFIDIGVPEDYYRFCRWIASNKAGTL